MLANKRFVPDGMDDGPYAGWVNGQYGFMPPITYKLTIGQHLSPQQAVDYMTHKITEAQALELAEHNLALARSPQQAESSTDVKIANRLSIPEHKSKHEHAAEQLRSILLFAGGSLTARECLSELQTFGYDYAPAGGRIQRLRELARVKVTSQAYRGTSPTWTVDG